MFVDVYYICRRPFFEYEVEQDLKIFMANCSKCNKWYHQKCVIISENIFENSRLDWVCLLCSFGIVLMSKTFTLRIYVYDYDSRKSRRIYFNGIKNNSKNKFLTNRSYINCVFFKIYILRKSSKFYLGLQANGFLFLHCSYAHI